MGSLVRAKSRPNFYQILVNVFKVLIFKVFPTFAHYHYAPPHGTVRLSRSYSIIRGRSLDIINVTVGS
jgi:hypothetical protein